MSGSIAAYMTLREIIQAHRKAKSLSQADMAKLIDVDGQTISNIETGRTKTLKPANLRRLANVLEKPIEEISALAASVEVDVTVDAGIDMPQMLSAVTRLVESNATEAAKLNAYLRQRQRAQREVAGGNERGTKPKRAQSGGGGGQAGGAGGRKRGR